MTTTKVERTRCAGWRRYGGAFTLGRAEWKQCENAATLLLRTVEDGKESDVPACERCWREAVGTQSIAILRVEPIGKAQHNSQASTSDVCHELTIAIGQLAAVRYDAVDLNDEQVCERLTAIIERVRACRDAVGIGSESAEIVSSGELEKAVRVVNKDAVCFAMYCAINGQNVSELLVKWSEHVASLGLGSEPSDATTR